MSGCTSPAFRAGIRAPVGQACTHSPQATQVLSPISSPMSNTICECLPRCAKPITSFTCSSRQARTQRLHWIQASRLTAMAGCEWSGATGSRVSKRGEDTFSLEAQWSSSESSRYGDGPCCGMSASNSSTTIFCECRARVESLFTCMPSAGLRQQDGARVRSPSISTMQARQLPSAR